jgi:hypothetical protein
MLDDAEGDGETWAPTTLTGPAGAGEETAGDEVAVAAASATGHTVV